MSVLLVTDDADDDVRTHCISSHPAYLYTQLKELEYDFNSCSLAESSSSITGQSSPPSRQHRRRRRARSQPCWVQRWLTYMLTLLFLSNQLHWSVIFLSLSSIKVMSTHALTSNAPAAAGQRSTSSMATAGKRPPSSTPSTSKLAVPPDDQQCLPIDGFEIDRICSKTCRAQHSPIDSKLDSPDQSSFDATYLPFCSNLAHQKLVEHDFFNTTSEQQCRERFKQLLEFDHDAEEATKLFATYLEAIDSASEENRYSIITADCRKAYRVWACSVRIPFFHRNQRILPCQTICDEVERVCPTFRPSDREPNFAGQPLFFCNGGIVPNSDYGYRPHCFDSCHVLHGSLKRPSTSSSSSSSSLSNNSSLPFSPLAQFVEDIVTTPLCFEIEPLPSPAVDSLLAASTFANESLFTNGNNASLAASARTMRAPSGSSILVILIVVFLQRS